MESKITSLIFLSREYNQSSDEDINLTVEEGKPTVYVMGDRYQANTWEEVLDKVLQDGLKKRKKVIVKNIKKRMK